MPNEKQIDEILCSTVRIKQKSVEQVFAKISDGSLNISNNNKLEIFALGIDNNLFSYDSLFDLLKDNIGSYALSRQEYKKNPERAISAGTERMRPIFEGDCGSGGELGELLLYIFLEYYLKAPKILTKMELKTVRSQYIFGADGVHFHSFENNGAKHFQLILYESKLKKNIDKAITKAFESITEVNTRKGQEISLVASELFKETFSDEDAQLLLSYVIPNQTEDFTNNLYKNYAFSIFIGFDYAVSEGSVEQQRAKLIADLKTIASEAVGKINKQIEKHKLTGYSFYVYLLPFNDIESDRKNLLKQLIENNRYERHK